MIFKSSLGFSSVGMNRKSILVSVFAIILLFGCDKLNIKTDDEYDLDVSYDTILGITFSFLEGTWIKNESFALQFIDFYSESQARFGFYAQSMELYDTFNYRFVDTSRIAIAFLGNTGSNETLHTLIIVDDETIEITDFTDIPENPNQRYTKRELIRERVNDTIIVGHKQVYFDPEKDFWLQLDSVANDSRCPILTNCLWEGNAEVFLDLIVAGNSQHFIRLNTNKGFQTDTSINNLTIRLVGLVPYPEVNGEIDQNEYKVKLLTDSP